MCSERQKEQQNLMQYYQVILENIGIYRKQEEKIKVEIKDLYDRYHSGDVELHNNLLVSISMEGQIQMELRKNENAKKKPYFGRIDYLDKMDGEKYSFYLGKNGVMKDRTEVLIVDWRAPVASIYYECQIGEGSYFVPDHGEYKVELELKRTYEVEEDRLVDFYDSEVVTNDELLTKYLAKNKEAVLGEIIATIQKEQNEIIRQTPYKNVIVQGVAGSGKTTVAMHRISYILYNYGKKFRAEEFYIIGSNRMLLNYITGVLPDLDVYQINQMVLEEFFRELLERDFLKKDVVLYQDRQEAAGVFLGFKGSLDYLDLLEEQLQRLERDLICTDSIWCEGTEVYSQEAILEFLKDGKKYSIQSKILMLNMRAVNKIKTYYEMQGEEKDVIRREGKKYQEHFGKRKLEIHLLEVYMEFLQWLLEERKEYRKEIEELMLRLKKRRFDVYDLAALVYIRYRVKMTTEYDFVKHIVVDEAQDFGAMVFGVMKRVLPDTTFTIMGDVSQNIHYDCGMNDWEELTQRVFSSERDLFYVLAKSYRNTVEISEYAEKILKKCSFASYRIEPIIRHGRNVFVCQEEREDKSENGMILRAFEVIRKWQQDGYETIAVICQNDLETEVVAEGLGEKISVQKMTAEGAVFFQGVMVLPIYLAKGLEFDTVLLWNPTCTHYPRTDGNGKLLYVACTRALHELGILVNGRLSELLEEE